MRTRKITQSTKRQKDKQESTNLFIASNNLATPSSNRQNSMIAGGHE